MVWQHARVRTYTLCPGHTLIPGSPLSRAESLGHHQAGCDPGSESWQEGPGRHGLGESRLSEAVSLVQMAPRA